MNSNSSPLAGVDGCKYGWLVALSATGDLNDLRFLCTRTFAEVIDVAGPGAVIAVDIPIGLPDVFQRGGRVADRISRALLQSRGSSVFPCPVRGAVQCETYVEACQHSRATGPDAGALSKQAFAISPKIREVDRILQEQPPLRERVVETHPDVAFCILAGEPLQKKKSSVGRSVRLEILRQHGIADPTTLLPRAPSKYQPDDVIDAAVCLLVARDHSAGASCSIPDDSPRDGLGIPMRIVVPHRQGSGARESDLLHHIRRRSADLTGLAGAFGVIVVGPGDDCAVIREPGGGLLVIGVDQLVEGRHFETGTATDLIARKAVARAVSDLAAMGARPAWGLATGLLPAGYSEADALFDAMAKWARHFGCPLIGGDIAVGGIGSESRSTTRIGSESQSTQEGRSPLSLTVTAAGTMDDGCSPLLRSGARVGDELWLTGPIGASFETGWHLSFEPRIASGLAAAASPRVHAAIDISDGLGRDAARMGEASGVVLELDAGRIPISARCRGWREAASAGEDYELLLATAPSDDGTPPFVADPPLLGPIGTVRQCAGDEAAGAHIVDTRGTAHDACVMGWDHKSGQNLQA